MRYCTCARTIRRQFPDLNKARRAVGESGVLVAKLTGCNGICCAATAGRRGKEELLRDSTIFAKGEGRDVPSLGVRAGTGCGPKVFLRV